METEFVILPFHEVFYIESLRFCTDSALSSAGWVMRLLDGIEKGDSDFDPQPALNQLQNVSTKVARFHDFFGHQIRNISREASSFEEYFLSTKVVHYGMVNSGTQSSTLMSIWTTSSRQFAPPFSHRTTLGK